MQTVTAIENGQDGYTKIKRLVFFTNFSLVISDAELKRLAVGHDGEIVVVKGSLERKFVASTGRDEFVRVTGIEFGSAAEGMKKQKD